ncbi:MAG: lytic murein transglycosylase B [Pseudomonadales bacterium]
MDLKRLAIAATLVVGAAVLLLDRASADYAERQDVQEYMAELGREYAFDAAELRALFADAEREGTVLERISRPAERVLKWHEYRPIFIEEPRIEQGLAFWHDNEALLSQAEARFGVPPEYVVAILGVETRYGRITGGFRVLDALTTLAFDYPPRSAFFRRELTEFLLLAREEGRDPRTLKGSYAGAMGYGQFIPSSFRAYAVDFDGDGQRDIWSNRADAIGSIANYFSRHGWETGQPVAAQVQVTDARADAVANSGLKLSHSVAELEALGVAVDGIDPRQPAALFRMDLAEGAEYWLGLNNFHVITRYNRSPMYALAVHQLSQEIRLRRDAQLAVVAGR